MITPQAEEALTLSQGHSRTVAEKYYQIKNLREAAVVAATTHESMYGLQDIPNITSEEDEEYVPKDDEEEEGSDVTPIKRFSPKRKRVSWIHEEEEWIKGWVRKHLESPQYNSKINWKLCLKDLRTDQDILPFFPDEHQDSTKIMECAKRMAKKVKQSIADMCQETDHVRIVQDRAHF